MLDKSSSEAWLDLPQATQAESATKLIKAVEDSAFKVVKTAKEPEIVVNVQVNVGKKVSYIVLKVYN